MIRFATNKDIPFIVKEGINFLQYHPSNIYKDVDVPYLRKLADTLITDHVVFIAEEGGKPVGMIAGFLMPNIFNPNYIVLQELFWWMTDAVRSPLLAFKLYKEFETHGKEIGVSVISMVTTEYTPTLDKWYKRKGFKPVERSFIKEL